MRRLLAAAALIGALAASLAARPAAAGSELVPGMAVVVPYRSPADGADRHYALRLPRSWDGTSRLPAILLLHGRGGTMAQFQRAEYHDAADVRGVVLVFWEGRVVPGGLGIPSTHYVDGVDGVPDETDVLACLDDALARAPIDPDRVALAGFSQGGRGALNVGLLNPTRFAALVDAAGPTDAFQGQLWSPTFPDYLSAAGGPASAGGEVLARWFELSPRYLLPNARNLFVAVLHGQADTVVPDSPALFPYRNGHHVAVTPGFADARGPQPTLAELRGADPEGFAFSTSFPADVGHEQSRLLGAGALFDAALGKTRPARPTRVVGVSFGARERTFHWARLARRAAPDGSRVLVDARADAAANGLRLATEGPARVRLDLAAAGLDAARSFSVRLSGGALDLSLDGPFPAALDVSLDGAPAAFSRTAGGLLLTGLAPQPGGSLLLVAPAPGGPLAGGDLLVPAVVRADGANGARWETVLAAGNLSSSPLVLEALLLDGASTPFEIALPPLSSRALGSAQLLAATPPGPAAAPLRLRVLSGDRRAVVASARVSNVAEGSYGLSFPVVPASSTVLASGSSALLFGPPDPGAERLNVSLFAPFETSSADVVARDAAGAVRRARRVDLGPLRRVQLDDLLAAEAPGASVRVDVLAGRLAVYGTAVSNSATNDPWRVPALPLASAVPAWTVPAVASAPGRNDAYFRSDLLLLSPSGATVEATLLPRDGSAPENALLSTAAGVPLAVRDLLAALFPSKAPGAGALRLASTAPFLPLALTRSAPPTGDSSQDLTCVAAGDEARPERPVAFAGVDESPAARSNLVLVAPGSLSRARLALLAPDGPRGEVSVDVAAGKVVQLDSFAALFPGGPVTGATLVVRVEGGPLVASVARIDNGTNDPAGLAPIPVGLP